MKNTFLGSVEIELANAITGEVTRQYELVATESLDKGEYLHFMNQVFDWCVSIGCNLTVPIKSEYRELIKRQNN